MSEPVSVELNEQQRDVLLQGLRYVRSSILLNVDDPTPEFVQERTSRLREVTDLAALLSGRTVGEKASAARS